MAVILIMASILVGCAKSPYTGRSQLMVMSEEQEQALGLEASQEVKKREDIISTGPGVDRITDVGLRIAAAVGNPEMTWEFLLVKNDETVNAFALPGGKIFVYTGLLNLASTNPELATVMAHEVAHVLARHGAERLSTQMFISLGGQAGAVALGMGNSAVASVFSQVYGTGVNVGVMLPFSRNMESEADYIGLILMAKAGYDPESALTFWRKMAKNKGGKSVPAWLSTHPTNAARIEKIQKALPEIKKKYWKP